MSVLRCDIRAKSAASYSRSGNGDDRFVSAAANLHALT
jgi:hypothetical protein